MTPKTTIKERTTPVRRSFTVSLADDSPRAGPNRKGKRHPRIAECFGTF